MFGGNGLEFEKNFKQYSCGFNFGLVFHPILVEEGKYVRLITRVSMKYDEMFHE